MKIESGVAVATLNRPSVRNAIDELTRSELVEILDRAANDPEISALVLTGKGTAFCAGGDISAMQQRLGAPSGQLGGSGWLRQRRLHGMIGALHTLEKPTIAAVNGAAAGAGLSLACACDIRVAADSASFVPAFIGIGLVPDSGGTYFLVRLLGYARAFEWMTSNRKLTAAEAHAWGLVSEVVEADRLAARAAEIGAEYAAAPTVGIGMTKRLFDRASTASLDDQLEWEAQLQTAATQTEDFREGVAAFLEKREPRFVGK